MNTMTTKNLRELLKDSEEVRLEFHALLEGGGSLNLGMYNASYREKSNCFTRVRRAGRPRKPEWRWPTGIVSLWRVNGESLGDLRGEFDRTTRVIHQLRRVK
jgi:hypothetical protein